MARYGITYEDVASAASQLTAQGRQPTIELIRQSLGTGSSTTISNYLRQWRADQKNGLAASDIERVPKEMVGMLQDFWGRLSGQAEQKVNEVEAKAQQEMVELKEALEKYKSNNTRWQKLFHQWQEERERLLVDDLLHKKTIESQQQEIAVLNARIEAQEFQANEKKLHIEDLHRMHQQVQANLEHYRESTREQRLIEQTQFEQQKQEMQKENKLLKEHIVIRENKINTALLEINSIENSYHLLQLECEQKDRTIRELKTENEKCMEMILICQRDNVNSQRELDARLSQLINTTVEVVSSAKQSYRYLENLQGMMEESAKLTHKILALNQEEVIT